jgi:predicted PurR-regulated permease PerM
MNQPSGRPHWSTQTKLTVSLLMLAFGIFLLIYFQQIISPFILAVILAYILAPLARRFHLKLHTPRWLSILLAYLIFIAIVIAIPALIIPYLTAQFGGINIDTQLLINSLESRLAAQYQILGYSINLSSQVEQLIGSLQQLIQPVIGQTISLATQIVTSLIWMVFIFVVSFYLIKDGDNFIRWIEHLLPENYVPDFVLVRSEINAIWSAFFRGQLLLSVVVALIFTTVGVIIGLPFVIAMGFLAGLLEFIPSIGHGIWLTIAVIISLLLGSTWLPVPNWVFALMVVALHVVFQQFDLNYLIPRIIGRSVRLPALVVIIGVVAAAVSVGVLGIPLAAPTIASARVVGRYIYAQLFDLDPFPILESSIPPLPPPDPEWWRRMSFRREQDKSADES